MGVDSRQLLGFLEEIGGRLERDIELIAVGGTAMTLLGLKPSTIDIDFNVSGEDSQAFRDALESVPHGFRVDIFEDGNVFSQQLPEGFEGDSIAVRKVRRISLKALHPLDIVVTKIGRLDDRDIEDIRSCIKGYGLTREQVRERAGKVGYAGREENYQHNLEHVLENLFG